MALTQRSPNETPRVTQSPATERGSFLCMILFVYMKFRKKPVEVEALLVQPQYRNLEEIIAFVGDRNLCPIERRPDYVLKIKTLEGDMSVGYGDWIIKGIQGEFYPCKPDIFEQTYEPV